MADEVATKEEVLAGVDFAALLGNPASNPEPKTALEKSLETVTPQAALAEAVEEQAFSFRSLLTPEQRAQLEKAAPVAARKMLEDYNAIISFGEPVLAKMNSMSQEMLREQRDIKVPAADNLVSDLLREIDGFEKKYRNPKVEELTDKVLNFFKGVKYSLKTMVRDMKPIEEKINLVEVEIRQMEMKLADNVVRGQALHKQTTETLEEVVTVLAALEQILEVAKAETLKVEALVKATEASAVNGLASADYEGKTYSLAELKDLHAQMAGGVSELTKSEADWRTQFFLGYASAPSIRNLILVSSTMQRRCQVFRTMAVPSARRALVMWQQAVLAKEGAEMGEAVQKGTNDLIQKSFDAAATSVEQVAMAAQAPVITEETIFAIADSVRRQCEGLVAADKWGREQRARNLKAMEASEKAIDQDFSNSRRQMVESAMVASSESALEPAPEVPDTDILGQLGVK